MIAPAMGTKSRQCVCNLHKPTKLLIGQDASHKINLTHRRKDTLALKVECITASGRSSIGTTSAIQYSGEWETLGFVAAGDRAIVPAPFPSVWARLIRTVPLCRARQPELVRTAHSEHHW